MFQQPLVQWTNCSFIAIFVEMCYDIFRARQTLRGRRLPSFLNLEGEGSFPSGKEGMCMVTFEELFLLLSLLVAVANFVFILCKHIFETKKK